MVLIALPWHRNKKMPYYWLEKYEKLCACIRCLPTLFSFSISLLPIYFTVCRCLLKFSTGISILRETVLSVLILKVLSLTSEASLVLFLNCLYAIW